MTFTPLCPACREHSPTTFHHSCQGCQARRVAAERAAALSDEHVGFADSMFQTLPETTK